MSRPICRATRFFDCPVPTLAPLQAEAALQTAVASVDNALDIKEAPGTILKKDQGRLEPPQAHTLAQHHPQSSSLLASG